MDAANSANERDRHEREVLVRSQADERRRLQSDIQAAREREKQVLDDLYKDRVKLGVYEEPVQSVASPENDRLEALRQQQQNDTQYRLQRLRNNNQSTGYHGPELER